MEIKDIVSQKLKNSDIEDADIVLGIEEATQYVYTYCGIEEIPAKLNFVVANMSLDLIRYQYESTRDTSQMSLEDTVDPANIASIKEGDTTITLGASKNATNLSARAKTLGAHTPNLDNIFFNYKEQLQNFRELY